MFNRSRSDSSSANRVVSNGGESVDAICSTDVSEILTSAICFSAASRSPCCSARAEDTDLIRALRTPSASSGDMVGKRPRAIPASTRSLDSFRVSRIFMLFERSISTSTVDCLSRVMVASIAGRNIMISRTATASKRITASITRIGGRSGFSRRYKKTAPAAASINRNTSTATGHPDCNDRVQASSVLPESRSSILAIILFIVVS